MRAVSVLVAMIVVVIMVVVVVIVAMLVIVVPENQHGHAVDDKTQDSDPNRLIERNGNRRDEPLHALGNH